MKSLVLGLLAAEQDLISNLITSTEVLTFNWPAWDLLVSTGKSDDSPVVSFLLGRRTCLNNGFFANSFPFLYCSCSILLSRLYHAHKTNWVAYELSAS